MQNTIGSNAGPIALGVTFVAGLAWLLFGCGGAENPGFGAAPAMHGSAIVEPAELSAVDSGADVNSGPDAGPGASPGSTPGAVWAQCQQLPVDTYCPGSAASGWGPADAGQQMSYWCHGAPDADLSPGPGCTYVLGSDWDGGGVVAGQWCCR